MMGKKQKTRLWFGDFGVQSILRDGLRPHFLGIHAHRCYVHQSSDDAQVHKCIRWQGLAQWVVSRIDSEASTSATKFMLVWSNHKSHKCKHRKYQCSTREAPCVQQIGCAHFKLVLQRSSNQRLSALIKFLYRRRNISLFAFMLESSSFTDWLKFCLWLFFIQRRM